MSDNRTAIVTGASQDIGAGLVEAFTNMRCAMGAQARRTLVTLGPPKCAACARERTTDSYRLSSADEHRCRDQVTSVAAQDRRSFSIPAPHRSYSLDVATASMMAETVILVGDRVCVGLSGLHEDAIYGHHVFDINQETSMNLHKSITRTAAALSISLLTVALAHAQGLSTATGSTDIYTFNFQKAYPSAGVTAPVKGGSIGTGSTDIWATNFQKAFATRDSVPNPPTVAAYTGSTDIYTTNFQRSSL